MHISHIKWHFKKGKRKLVICCSFRPWLPNFPPGWVRTWRLHKASRGQRVISSYSVKGWVRLLSCDVLFYEQASPSYRHLCITNACSLRICQFTGICNVPIQSNVMALNEKPDTKYNCVGLLFSGQSILHLLWNVPKHAHSLPILLIHCAVNSIPLWYYKTMYPMI